ncbi:unnamed protein product, partial [Ectocarpus fasciculatus]
PTAGPNEHQSALAHTRPVPHTTSFQLNLLKSPPHFARRKERGSWQKDKTHQPTKSRNDEECTRGDIELATTGFLLLHGCRSLSPIARQRKPRPQSSNSSDRQRRNAQLDPVASPCWIQRHSSSSSSSSTRRLLRLCLPRKSSASRVLEQQYHQGTRA